MKKLVLLFAMLMVPGAEAATEKNKKIQNIICANSTKECGVVLENRSVESAHPTCYLASITIPNVGTTDKSFVQSALSVLLAAKMSSQTVTIDFTQLGNGRCEMTTFVLGTTL